MIIFLYGEDTFRSRQKLKEFKDKFLREVDSSGNSLNVVNGGISDTGQIREIISSRSLLSKKRMIVIEELFLNKNSIVFEQLFKYFQDRKKVEDDDIIIFWDSTVKTKKIRTKEEFLIIDSVGREKPLTQKPLNLFKFLLSQKYSQQFNLLSNTDTVGWVKKEVASRGGKISQQAAQLLTSLTGCDLWQIDNEIEKLLIFKSAGKLKLKKEEFVVIEAGDVEKLVRGVFDENIFALTDAISNKNRALAVKLLGEQVEAGLTDSYLLNMFTRQFRILLQIRQAIDSGHTSRKIINLLKLHPFVVQKGISQVRNFNLITLKNILNQLVEIDYEMKTGKADAQTMLNLLLAKI